MGSDRARLSYDAKQQYRSVVAQQGRVTLEADSNEAQQIISEELREETLDFVGSSGTPDDGYEVQALENNGSFDFSVSPGTMYVGGIRVFLDAPTPPTPTPTRTNPLLIKYSDQKQTEWLDYKSDPDWVEPSAVANATLKQEFIYLHLREQEVSAVEDSALREVALGGPDTTQRVRLIQRIVRLSTDKTECSSALGTAITAWNNKGLNYDPKTMRLMSAATLKVETNESAPPSDPCDPAARGGYLGAENQLIRVQISQSDSTGYKLVWGFDNASFLYRVKAKNNTTENNTTNTTLQLQSQPVDDFHRPKKDQAVEVLRSAAKLSNGEYVASATGFVTKLAAPYDPVSQEITFPSLPNEYLDASQTPQLFLRVWEEEKPFESGKSVILGDTGLQVTLQTSGNQPFHIGDYWIFAVRPSTPEQVYPKRYLPEPNKPQPQSPDGPRLWVCPLAVIGWEITEKATQIKLLDDCRNLFDNLIQLTKRKFGGGCCTVTVRPEDLKQGKTLQSILDKFTNMARVTICLMPGNYQLPKPLVLGSKHSNLTLEGCHDGVILHADDQDINQFLDGLIVVSEAKNVTLRRLQLELPLVPLAEAVPQFRNMEPLLAALQRARLPKIGAAIGIRPVNCDNLAIQDCIFNYSLSSELDLFEAGIFVGGDCTGLTVQGNQFVARWAQTYPDPRKLRSVVRSGIPMETPIVATEASPSVVNQEVGDAIAEPTAEAASIAASPGVSVETTTVMREVSSGITSLLSSKKPLHILFGYLQLPSATLTSSSGETRTGGNSTTGQLVMGSLLQDAFFLDNQFTGLSFATLIISNIGAVKFKDNTVRECLAGFWLESLGFWKALGTKNFLQNLNKQEKVFQEFQDAIFKAILNDPVTVLGTELALFYPLPQGSRESLVEQGSRESLVEVDSSHVDTGTAHSPAQESAELEKFRPILAKAHRELKVSLSVHLSDNAIDALTMDAESSSIGLLILGDSPQDKDKEKEIIDLNEIIVSANKIRNRAPNAPTAVILLAQRCTITGNLILNEAPLNDGERLSLVFLPLSGSNQFAITGNVFQGKSNLGVLTRSDYNAPPLNTWLFANSCNV
jgi:hypothetical protein